MKKFLFIVLGLIASFTLLACTDNKVEVTFNPMNGSEPTVLSVESGSEIAAPETNPTKDGYVFLHWALEGETQKIDFPLVVEVDQTFVAIYEEEDTSLQDAHTALVVGFASGDSATSVTQDVTLATASGDVTISWASNNASVISNSGVVVRPSHEDDDATVVLTATLSYDGETLTKEFTLVVLANEVPPAPVAEGILWHWMPAALNANVTADVDVFGADDDSFVLSYVDHEFQRYIDFDYEDGVLTIYGSTLEDVCGVTLGEYVFYIETEFGATTFTVIVVDDPTNTSIPTTTIQGIDMRGVEQATIAEKITGAPDILITGVIGDSTNGQYDYVEVFNNTASDYNLKNHRIVLSGVNYVTQGSLFLESGLMNNAIGQTFHYIYDDFQ